MTRSQRRARVVRETAAVAACLATAVLLADLLFYPETQEDAYIAFRYSRHLAEGYGLGAWNRTGEPVEGYTSALWMAWLSLAPFAGLRIETLAKLTGVAAHLALCLFVLWFPRLRDPALTGSDALLGAHRDAFAAAAIALGLYLPLCWYATSGMEVTAFALLVALALLAPVCTQRRAPIAVVFAALVWLRPEGALVGGGLAALHWEIRRRRDAPLGPAWAAVAAVPLAWGALTALRLAVFGDWLPNTFYAKAVGAGALHRRLGAVYLRDWLVHSWAWLVLAAVALARSGAARVRRERSDVLALAVATGLFLTYALYAWRVGGDNPSAFPYWRQLLHPAPLLFAVVGLGVLGAGASRAFRAFRYTVLAAALVSANLQALAAHQGRLREALEAALPRYPSLRHEPPDAYTRWVADLAGRDAVVASAAAGELPFVVDAVHVDMLGLNDREIAHTGRFDPNGPIDSKSDVDAVLRRKPDLILSTLHAKRFEEVSPRGSRILHRGAMEAALLNHPEFRAHYLFVRNAPYDVRDRAVFVRRAFWEALPQRALLEVVPVTRTAIYPRDPAGAPRPSL